MEQGRRSPPEARANAIAVFFGKETKKILDRLEMTKSLVNGIDTNGAVARKQQQTLHLERRLTELDHARAFISRVLTNATQTSEISNIGYYFVGKLDEIDLEIERRESRPREVIIENGIVRGKRQELLHLAALRADMLRVGNHVLGLLGEPPLIGEKNPATI